MRIPKVVKSGTKLNTKSIMLIAIAVTLSSSVSSVVAHATQAPLIDGSSSTGSSSVGSTIDVSGSAHGDQIIAGIEIDGLEIFASFVLLGWFPALGLA